MNINPRRVHIERGDYRRPSLDVALIGPCVVDTAWALNTLAVRPLINCPWHVQVAERNNAGAIVAAWEADLDGSSHLLIWPAEQYLAWNAVLESVQALGNVAIGAATLYRRYGDRSTTSRSDLVLDAAYVSASAGHPVVADAPDARIDPALSIAIGIPSLGRVGLVWAKHLAELKMPIGTVCNLVYLEGFEVGDARERIVDRVLAAKPRPAFLLFLGDDNLPPSGMLQKLYDDLQAYPDVAAIGGMYTTKADPPQVCAWNATRTLRPGVDFVETNQRRGWICDSPGEILAVRAMGLDACLLRTSWLAKIPTPRFQTTQEMTQQNTEDCHLWVQGRRATGRDPWIDTSIRVGHLDIESGRTYWP